MKKELYSCPTSALLFYYNLVGDLEAYGYKINLYELCVANMMGGGKHITLFWHMNDLKISCVNRNEEKMIQWLESENGDQDWR